MQVQLSEHANLDRHELFRRLIVEHDALAMAASDGGTPERIEHDSLDRGELWRIASGVVQSEQERVALVESYVYALPPQVILARHPNLFADAEAIYATKRHLLDHLKRCPALWPWYQEK